jgi:hypothetical protein
MKAWAWYAALAAGAAAVVGVTYAVKSPSPAVPPPNPPPTPVPPLQTTAAGAGGASLTVSPGIAVQTVPLDVQDPVVIHLPDKGQWQSMDGAPVSDKTSPIAFTFLGPINHTLVWYDAQGQQYVTSYFFVVNQNSTPSTST